jgi:hypothetical protein
MQGVSTPDSASFFYYSLSPVPADLDQVRVLRHVAESVGGPQDFIRLYTALDEYFLELCPDVAIKGVAFNLTTGHHDNHFLTAVKAVGYFLTPNRSVEIYGFGFDEDAFVAEGRIFGVVTSIGILLTALAWLTLQKRFVSTAQLSQLSVHSFIMHMAFDFSYSVFILRLSGLHPRLWPLYALLFLLMSCSYFGVEIRQVSEVWKTTVRALDDLQPAELRQLFGNFFLEVTTALFVFAIATSFVIQAPVVALPLLYSFFIPQISHSIRSPVRKTDDVSFLLIISLTRLVPVWYFSCYKGNILSVARPSVALWVTVYVGIQLTIILLQNWLGGAFFLARSMRPIPFDYRAEALPDEYQCPVCLFPIHTGDDTMVTPCHHGFHAGCLTRWMQEQLVCPVCRRELPAVGDH